jgi:hypothetical protein
MLSSGAILWLVVILGPPLVGAVLYIAAGSHKVLPGMTGCKYVRNSSVQIDCYADEIIGYRKSHSLKATLGMVTSKAKTDASLSGSCHLSLHQMGEPDGRREAKSKQPFHPFDDSNWCTEGYIHGFYIGYLSSIGASVKSAGPISKVCGGLAKPEATYNCTHAFGHSMARTTPSRAEASKGCEALSMSDPETDAKAKRDCFYGMFMEYTLNDLAKGRTKPLNDCVDIPAVAEEGCFAFLPGRVERMTNSRTKAVEACDDYAPKGSLRELCIASFARTVTKASECEPLKTAEEKALCREKPLNSAAPVGS